MWFIYFPPTPSFNLVRILNQECFFSNSPELPPLEDFVAALSLASLPLAVAMNEAVASLVSGTGTEHNEERRTGQGISSLHPLMKPLLTPVFTPCSTSGERMEEQSNTQAM